ncbi:MAG: EAL domain-containing protein [Rhodospirillales bacterium]|nr:EAL domain-containing protein [Rhodospirillales bacterium]
MKDEKSIATRRLTQGMVLGTSLAVVTLVTILFGVWTWQQRREALQDAFANVRELSLAYRTYSEQSLDGIDQMLRIVAAQVALKNQLDVDGAVQTIIRTRKENTPILSDVVIMNDKGDVVSWLFRGAMPNLADRDYFAIHRERPDQGLYVSRAYEARVNPGSFFFAMSRRLVDSHGRFVGVIAAILSVEALSKSFDGLVKRGGASIGLIYDDGSVVARLPYLPQAIGRVIPSTAKLKGQMPELMLLSETSPVDGAVRIIAQWRLRGFPLSAAATVLEREVLASWTDLAAIVAAVWLVLVGLVACGAWVMLSLLNAQDRAQRDMALSEERLALAFEGSKEGLWDWDLASGRITFGGKWYAILGYEPGDIPATVQSWTSITHPDDRDRIHRALVEHLKGKTRACELEYRCRTGAGTWKWVLLKGRAMARDSKGLALRMVGTLTDIDERRRIDDDLRLAASVFSTSLEGIVITDAEGTILSVNQAFTDITGYPAGEVVGNNPRLLKSDHHDDAFYADMWRDLQDKGSWQGEIWNRKRSGEAYLEWQSISSVKDSAGRIMRYVAVFSDITELRRKDERLRHQAYHDPLTDLPNRLLLQDRLGHALEQASRDKGAVALLFLDLDRFKVVNDSLGHEVGDRLLQAVATRLNATLRKSDTVARLGGDEFMIVLADHVSSAEVAHTAERILEALSEPVVLAGHALHVTASIGISLFPADGEDALALMKNADTAMYQAKAQGRNTFRFFDAGMNSRALERLDLEASLRQAVAMGEFHLHFQPKIDLGTGRPSGAEALVRWHHPSKGLVSPADFIPVAEETGLIVPLGEWVLRTACRYLRRWHDEGLADLRLAVNLSARQFQDSNLIDRIGGIMTETGISPARIDFELTESTVMSQPDQTAATLAALRKAGFGLAVDDFGTGYSSLSYLKRLPIDTIKIDRSFVMDLGSNPEDAAIVRTILALGRTLGHTVIAEGVETAEQAALLKEWGCELAQGYYFARPMPAESFVSWLADQAPATS